MVDPVTLREVRIALADGSETSGLLQVPERCLAGLVLAHGAGAGMRHAFMAAAALALAERGIATLRFNFAYMHRGGGVPDRPPVARAAVRAVVEVAARLLPGRPLFAGGKSFGGRMTSEAQAEAPLPGIKALIFIGFPLHPAGKPSLARAAHLSRIGVPMLFLQGDRDPLADISLLRPVVEELAPLATLVELTGANHAFHVPVRSGRTDAEVLDEAMDRLAHWAVQEILS